MKYIAKNEIHLTLSDRYRDKNALTVTNRAKISRKILFYHHNVKFVSQLFVLKGYPEVYILKKNYF